MVIAKDNPTKLTINEAVRSGLTRNTPNILKQFVLIINTTSMEEALYQQAHAEYEDLIPNLPTADILCRLLAHKHVAFKTERLCQLRFTLRNRRPRGRPKAVLVR